MSIRRAPTELDRRGATPLWVQLLADLRRRLGAGEFTDAFPGELALVGEYRVSRHTVREALRRLRDEGLVVAERGRPPRLASPTEIAQPLGTPYSLFQSVEATGRVQRNVVRTLDVRADGVVAARLGLEESTPLVHLERLRFSDEEPLAIDRVWMPERLAAPLLDVDFARTALYDEYAARCGIRVTGGHEHLRAVVPADGRARAARHRAGRGGVRDRPARARRARRPPSGGTRWCAATGSASPRGSPPRRATAWVTARLSSNRSGPRPSRQAEVGADRRRRRTRDGSARGPRAAWTTNSPWPTCGGVRWAAADERVGDPAAVLHLHHEVLVSGPHLQQPCTSGECDESVDRQFLGDQPHVGRGARRPCRAAWRPRARAAARPARRSWSGSTTHVRLDRDGCAAARRTTRRPRRGRCRSGCSSARWTRRAWGAYGWHRSAPTPAASRCRTGTGCTRATRAERDVDQRLVLGAGGILLVRPARPDRLADDAHPPIGVLATKAVSTVPMMRPGLRPATVMSRNRT